MSTKERKIIQDPNLGVFVSEVVKAVLQGWELDEQNPPSLYGVYYETHLLIDENKVPVGKPSRAEILGNARKAKKAKLEASEGAQEPLEEEVEGVGAQTPENALE